MKKKPKIKELMYLFEDRNGETVEITVTENADTDRDSRAGFFMVQVSINGMERLHISSSQLVGIGWADLETFSNCDAIADAVAQWLPQVYRKQGFYWVEYMGHWIPAYYRIDHENGNGWIITDLTLKAPLSDSDFGEIDETPIHHK